MCSHVLKRADTGKKKNWTGWETWIETGFLFGEKCKKQNWESSSDVIASKVFSL